MSLSDELTNGLLNPPPKPKVEVPKLPQKLPKSTENYAPPGGVGKGKRKPLPRGEPFEHKNSLIKWSTR